MHIVVADPFEEDRAWIGRQLESVGHEVALVSDGASAIAMVDHSLRSLLVTEWKLGDMNGLELARTVKSSAQGRWTRILLISNRPDSPNVAEAIAGGIDDVLSKPCASEELVARADATMRRPGVMLPQGAIIVGPVTLDRTSHKIVVSGTELRMSPVEFRLLSFFMEHPGQAFTRQQLLHEVWSRPNNCSQRTVDVHIRRLRAVLEPHHCEDLLQTIHSFGYRFG